MASSTLVYCVSRTQSALTAHVGRDGKAIEPAQPDDTIDLSSTVENIYDDGYDWPENLYAEMRDMAVLSFLVYTFAYICDVARSTPGGLPGLGLYGSHNRVAKTLLVSEEGGDPNSIDLPRSFTPGEILKVVENNREMLEKKYQSVFGEGVKYELLLENVRKLKERAALSGIDRPLTVEEFDDRHQQEEMVYGITKDDIHKRITLVFRGTENALSFKTNWLTNVYLAKTKVELPDTVKKLSDNAEELEENMYLHSGFYRYIFQPTIDPTDDEEWLKYDEIVEDVKTLLKQNPGYKLYITGHSLGGALSAMVSFFLACDEEIPKPVTCISLASPRIGDIGYLKAVRTLERNKMLRFVRVVNDKDTVAAVPVTGYHHGGFQVKLYKGDKKPSLSYPKIGTTLSGKIARMWANSLLLSFNFGYDHGDYRERIEKHKGDIQKWNLNDLYQDEKLTGWEF